MKKLILFFSVALILCSGCVLPWDPPEEDLTGFKECTNEECIKTAVKNCDKAFADIKDEFMGADQAELKFIVFGMQEDKCKIKYEFGEIKQAEGQGNPISGMALSFIANKEMTCLVPKDKINLVSEGKLDDLIENYCSGSLVDSMNLLKETFGKMEN